MTGVNRIEHATMARRDQIDRMKALGVEPSFIPDFIYLYGGAFRDQIFGAERAEFMSPFGAAADAGLGFPCTPTPPPPGCRSIHCATCRPPSPAAARSTDRLSAPHWH